MFLSFLNKALQSTYFTNILRLVKYNILLIVNFTKMMINKVLDLKKDKPSVIVISLGKFGPSTEVAHQAYLSGFYVHVLSPEFPVREAVFAHNWTKIDTLKDFQIALMIVKKLKPVGILVESKNLLLPLQAYLADSLELRSIGSKAAKISNSKIALRQFLDSHEIKSIPWMKLEDFTSKSKFIFPAVIKPDLGTSSKGVGLVNCKEEVEQYKDSLNRKIYNDVSVSDNFLLEGYVKGRQFDFEGVAVDGEYKLICIVEEFYESLPPYFLPSCFYFNPPITENEYKVLWSNTKLALKALGVKNGAWHLEQRIDNHGIPYVIDFANRMGYNQLVTQASGVNFASTYVDIMTEKFKKIETLTPKTLLQIFALDENTIKKMRIFFIDHPKYVLSKSFSSFEFSYHKYFGYMVLSFDDLDLQKRLLDKYNLMPKNMNF